MSLRQFLCAVLLFLTIAPLAHGSDDRRDTFTWMSSSQDIVAEGILWNDRLGDGKDRYKSGGLTQSWLVPQSRISGEPWIADQAAALEVQIRGLVITPDNTAAATADRPYAQYLAAGVFLRTFGRANPVFHDGALSAENRIGIEIGYQGDPLPLFEIQEALHGISGMGPMARTDAGTLDSSVLVNLEVKRTWRLHVDAERHDVDVAPFAQISAGLRENSARIGADLIHGASLTARTWNHDPAIGALIPGGSKRRDGVNWFAWFGGDVAIVASDALLDGGFLVDGPATNAERFSARLRAGAMAEFPGFALSYSITWLSPEFEEQDQGQLIGAVQLKLRY